MKALTLWQPWASLIAVGAKTIETRGWSTSYRGPLAIHASKRCEVGAVGEYDVEKDNPRGTPPAYLMRGPMDWPYRLPLGAVVATCELVDVVPMVFEGEQENLRRLAIDADNSLWLCEPEPDDDSPDYPIQDWRDVSDQVPYGDYTPGRFAWLLEKITPIEPISAKGKQGLWEWNS
jgi:hypothetical protein